MVTLFKMRNLPSFHATSYPVYTCSIQDHLSVLKRERERETQRERERKRKRERDTHRERHTQREIGKEREIDKL